MKRFLILALMASLHLSVLAANETEETAEVTASSEEALPNPQDDTPATPAAVPKAPATPPAAVTVPVVPTPPPSSVLAPAESQSALSAFSLGLQGGQSRTNITEPGFLTQLNFTSGGNVELHFVQNWSLQLEANYISKGYRGMDGLTQNEANLSYLEVPLFLKMRFPWSVLAPNVYAGPSVAYLHSAKITQSGTVTDTTSTTNRLEYSFYVGAGLDLLISEKISIGASARYGWGLSDINSGSFQADIFNRVLQVLAGVQFRL